MTGMRAEKPNLGFLSFAGAKTEVHSRDFCSPICLPEFRAVVHGLYVQIGGAVDGITRRGFCFGRSRPPFPELWGRSAMDTAEVVAHVVGRAWLAPGVLGRWLRGQATSVTCSSLKLGYEGSLDVNELG